VELVMLLEEFKMSRPIKKTGFRQGLYEQSVSRKEILGTMRITQDGRRFRYSLAGAGNLSQGKVNVAADATGDLIDEVQTNTTVSIGSVALQLYVTANTAALANELKGGYLMVNDNDTEGACYEIASNEVKASTATALFITLDEPIHEAIAATAQLSIHRSPWWKVIQSGDEENFPTGVPLIDVTASYYFWNQTAGVANVFMAGTPAIGALVCIGATAGTVGNPATLHDDQTKGHVGTKIFDAGVNGEYQAVLLQVD
jgi:hypothetical protein